MSRVLFYAEGPANTTGFSLVNRHIADALRDVCELTFVASSHWGHPDDATRGYTIVPCPTGVTVPQQRNLENAMRLLEARDWDIFLYQGDIGANDDIIRKAIQIALEDPSKGTVYYVPMDVDETTPETFDIANACHVPIFYTQRGADIAMKLQPALAGKVSVLGLGTDPQTFFPLSKEERRYQRKRIFDLEDDRFLVINVNRNQMRKDLARTMSYFHRFHRDNPHSMLYLHSVVQDYGGNLMLQAKMVGMDLFKSPCEIAFSGLDLSRPFSQADLNNMYNCADALVSTSYGEGWGLATTEAMCAGCPVVVPFNTANIDILGPESERGWGMTTGGNLDHTVYLYEGGGAPHDIVWYDSFRYQLGAVYMGTVPSLAGARSHLCQYEVEDRLRRVERARKWCLENTWDHKMRILQDLIKMLSGTTEVGCA